MSTTKRNFLIWLIATLLLGTLLAWGWAKTEPSNERSAPVLSQNYEPVAAPVKHIDPVMWQKQMRHDFIDYQINHSKNRLLPLRAYRTVWGWVHDDAVSAAKQYARAKVVRQWLGTDYGKRHIRAVACAIQPSVDWGTTDASPCMRAWVLDEDSPSATFTKKLTRFKILCGGAALLAIPGSAGNPWAIVGKGAAGCLWQQTANHWFD